MAEFTNGGEAIDLETALALVREYRSRYPDNIKAHLVDTAALRMILDQPGCAGVRIYQGMNPDRTLAPVLVGVDESGEDMTDGILVDKLASCPPLCSPSSVLMS